MIVVIVLGWTLLGSGLGAASAQSPPIAAPAAEKGATPTASEPVPTSAAPGSTAPNASAPVVEPVKPEGTAVPASNSDTGVEYAAVDAATHRVFAVGNVDLITVKAGSLEVPLAVPNYGHGTGFAVGTSGLIVTAGHVVDDAVHLVIRMPGDAGFFPAQVAYRDEEQDVAILWVAEKLVPIKMAEPSHRLRVRQTVFAIGYPLDATRTQAQSARGIVAGQLKDDRLQLDISLNPGNSGGPLVDEQDEVVGMVVARGSVEMGIQGLGLAIANPRIRRALAKAEVRLGKGLLDAPSPAQELTAEVVDKLLRLGAMGAAADNKDLSKGLTAANLEQEVSKLAKKISDPELLVILAGSMWNGGQALIYGEVREIGEVTLSDKAAKKLGRELREAGIDLVNRAYRLDKGVAKRSAFAKYIIKKYKRSRKSKIRIDTPEVEIDELANRGPVVYGMMNVFDRVNLNSGSSNVGIGVDVGIFLNSAKPKDPASFFGRVGVSAGEATLFAESDGAKITHQFIAVEMAAGMSYPVGTSSRFDLSFSLLPGQYSTSVRRASRIETEDRSVFLLGHVRAAASLTMGNYRLGVGAHLIGASTVWLEPARIGVVF